jgi:hypothetical protein
VQRELCLEVSVEPVRFPFLLPSDAAQPLFLQRAGRTVLIGYREDECWVLARGWRSGDRFTDIRCWRFASPERFITQVGRLTREVDGTAYSAARDSARFWVLQALPR